MAQLQLDGCSHMDPMVSDSSLQASSQERCLNETVREQSQLDHLRTNIQLLCNQDKTLNDLHSQKIRSASCSRPSDSHQLIWEKAGSYSADAHNWYLKGQARTLPTQWRAKRREGVDRAYPLKPVLHHQAPIPTSWQAESSAAVETPLHGTSSEKKEWLQQAISGRPARMPSPFSVEQYSKAASKPGRTELGYIQKLEAAGRSLEEEIQRKEALLREKLRRTEEELRRIQWKRQQAEAETRKERGALWNPEKKPAGITRGHLSTSLVRPSGGQRVHGPESSVVSVLFPPEPHVEKLKKQRLVASNSKLRENVPQEKPTTSGPEQASKYDQGLPTTAPFGQAVCVAAELSYTEAPSNVEDWGECRFCGRKLYCSRLEKHMSICSKNYGSKRKVFDSSKARAKGTELETYYLLKGSDTFQVIHLLKYLLCLFI